MPAAGRMTPNARARRAEAMRFRRRMDGKYPRLLDSYVRIHRPRADRYSGELVNASVDAFRAGWDACRDWLGLRD